jgi:hypothetical protein
MHLYQATPHHNLPSLPDGQTGRDGKLKTANGDGSPEQTHVDFIKHLKENERGRRWDYGKYQVVLGFTCRTARNRVHF